MRGFHTRRGRGLRRQVTVWKGRVKSWHQLQSASVRHCQVDGWDGRATSPHFPRPTMPRRSFSTCILCSATLLFPVHQTSFFFPTPYTPLCYLHGQLWLSLISSSSEDSSLPNTSNQPALPWLQHFNLCSISHHAKLTLPEALPTLSCFYHVYFSLWTSAFCLQNYYWH